MHSFFRFEKQLTFAVVLFVSVFFFSCSKEKKQSEDSKESPEAIVKENDPETVPDEAPAHGVGPVESVSLTEDIDAELAATGETIFQSKCIACHSFDQKLIGPAMAGVTERRNPAWIMNMILNPIEMTQKDSVAKALLEEYSSQMVNMNVTEEDARAILEYLRLKDSQG